MSFSESELNEHTAVMDRFLKIRRPPEEMRDKVDLSYRVRNQSIEIFSIRPKWSDKSETYEDMIARATWVKSRKIWKVYWMMSDMKWHPYEPESEVKSLNDFIRIVLEDKSGCFWG
jgi:hypothetical protein